MISGKSSSSLAQLDWNQAGLARPQLSQRAGEVYFSLKVENAVGQLIGSSCLPCSNVRFVKEGSKLFIRTVKKLSGGNLLWMSYGTGFWAKMNDKPHAKCGVCGVSLILND